MRAPKRLGAYAERAADCEQALEDAIVEIVDAAANVGWDRDEIWTALSSTAKSITAAETGQDLDKSGPDTSGDKDKG